MFLSLCAKYFSLAKTLARPPNWRERRMQDTAVILCHSALEKV